MAFKFPLYIPGVKRIERVSFSFDDQNDLQLDASIPAVNQLNTVVMLDQLIPLKDSSPSYAHDILLDVLSSTQIRATRGHSGVGSATIGANHVFASGLVIEFYALKSLTEVLFPAVYPISSSQGGFNMYRANAVLPAVDISKCITFYAGSGQKSGYSGTTDLTRRSNRTTNPNNLASFTNFETNDTLRNEKYYVAELF